MEDEPEPPGVGLDGESVIILIDGGAVPAIVGAVVGSTVG